MGAAEFPADSEGGGRSFPEPLGNANAQSPPIGASGRFCCRRAMHRLFCLRCFRSSASTRMVVRPFSSYAYQGSARQTQR